MINMCEIVTNKNMESKRVVSLSVRVTLDALIFIWVCSLSISFISKNYTLAFDLVRSGVIEIITSYTLVCLSRRFSPGPGFTLNVCPLDACSDPPQNASLLISNFKAYNNSTKLNSIRAE